MRMKTLLHALLLASVFLLLFGRHVLAATSEESAEALVFAVPPFQGARKLAKRWLPMVRYLEKQTGYDFRFETAPDISAFDSRVALARYDLAFISPAVYLKLAKTSGYKAIAREQGKQLQGIIVVAADSPYNALQDLRGEKIGMPSRNANEDSILVDLLGSIAYVPVFLGSHEAVYRSVSNKLVQAGGGMEKSFFRLQPGVRSGLRILARTEKFVSHPFVLHPRWLGTRKQSEITAALLGMADDDEGKESLQNLHLQALVRADDQDWNPVLKLIAPQTDMGDGKD